MSSTVSARPLLVTALLWFGFAIAISASGVLALLPTPGPQLFILLLTVTAVFVATRVPTTRAALDGISTRALVALHALRFGGYSFLWLAQRHELSELFAERAGWGDILVAALAVLLASFSHLETPLRRASLIAWNVLGMLDLVLAVGTAGFVVVRGDVPGMQAILRLPLALIPLFFVPLMFASHVVLLRRLRR